MQLSTDRILTTHVGSLPRPQPVVDLLLKRDRGEPYDPGSFDATVRQSVAEVVARQAELGIDIVNDGECSKVGYATYIKERLAGFGGEPYARKPSLDLAEFPDLLKRLAAFTGPQAFQRLCCVGPVSVKDPDAVRTDVANLTAAAAKSHPRGTFMTAASPGVVTAFQPNRYYKTHEAYVEAVGNAMKQEYEAIATSGIVLQLDCPDLAMARHTGFQDLTEAEFLARVEQGVEAINHALTNIPAASVRMHICWGNYEGPHHFDIAVEKILPIVLKAKPQAILFEAANPRHAHEWAAWKAAKLPDDKVLIPGVLDTCTNYVEHPELVAQRICQYTDIVGRERVIAGTDCGFATFVGNAGRVDSGVAERKLAAMVEGAAIASRRLWT
jgi:5-methyltetrahydropteroyltriglutamate--homocysteine methyltransferase